MTNRHSVPCSQAAKVAASKVRACRLMQRESKWRDTVEIPDYFDAKKQPIVRSGRTHNVVVRKGEGGLAARIQASHPPRGRKDQDL